MSLSDVPAAATGLGRGGQRADLINYLHTLADSPVPLPKAAEATPPNPTAEKK